MLQSGPSDCAITCGILWSALLEIWQVSPILHQTWWYHEISFILMPSWFLGKERSHTCNFGFLSSCFWRSQHVVTQFFIFSQSRRIDCLSKCSELTQMKFPHVCNITDSDSFVFKDNLFHSSHIFICFAHWSLSWAPVTFIRGHTTLENGKPPNNLCSTCCVLPKVNFQYFGSSTFFPHFKTCCALMSAIS